MRILVTGGSGFLGREVISYLNKRNIETLDYSLPESVCNRKVLLRFVQKADAVIHLAGLLGTSQLTENPLPAIDVNIKGSVNVMECIKGTPKRLVFVSKPNVWHNTYSITKQAAEEFCKMYGEFYKMDFVILKIFNAYGPIKPGDDLKAYGKVIPSFITKALKNEDIEIYGGGEQTVDLIYVKDIAKIIYQSVFSQVSGETIEVGSGVETTVNDLAQKIIHLTGSSSKIIHVPMRIGEAQFTRLCANTEKMLAKFGHEITADQDANLLETIESYRVALCSINSNPTNESLSPDHNALELESVAG